MKCKHRECGKTDRLILPTLSDIHEGTRPYYWCVECGLVKEGASKRMTPIEHYHNLVMWLHNNRHKMRIGELRAIKRELEILRDTDEWDNEIFREKFFISVIRKYTRLNDCEIALVKSTRLR